MIDRYYRIYALFFYDIKFLRNLRQYLELLLVLILFGKIGIQTSIVKVILFLSFFSYFYIIVYLIDDFINYENDLKELSKRPDKNYRGLILFGKEKLFWYSLFIFISLVLFFITFPSKIKIALIYIILLVILSLFHLIKIIKPLTFFLMRITRFLFPFIALFGWYNIYIGVIFYVMLFDVLLDYLPTKNFISLQPLRLLLYRKNYKKLIQILIYPFILILLIAIFLNINILFIFVGIIFLRIIGLIIRKLVLYNLHLLWQEILLISFYFLIIVWITYYL